MQANALRSGGLVIEMALDGIAHIFTQLVHVVALRHDRLTLRASGVTTIGVVFDEEYNFTRPPKITVQPRPNAERAWSVPVDN